MEMQRGIVPCSRLWYIAYSKPRKEEAALFHLQKKGPGAFFPQILLPHPALERRRVVRLFPNYLFVHLSLSEEYEYVRWCPGVKYLVEFEGGPAPLDEEIVGLLMQNVNPDGILKPHSDFLIGQEMFLKRDPFAGLVGLIQDPPDAQGRLSVLMEFLSRTIKVEVPVQYIEDRWSIHIGQ